VTTNLPATLESVITARIAPIIGEMIPEQTLRDTVKRTLDTFMASQLQPLIRAELEKRFTAILKTELDSPDYREIWADGGTRAGQKTEEMIRALVPDLVAAAMAAPFNQLLQNMRYQLQSMRG
jgi:hypothetical protein